MTSTPTDNARAAAEIVRMGKRIGAILEDGDGNWSACSGCQESVDGSVSERDYPYSELFRCQPGGGCSECGGLGVIWLDRSYYETFERDHMPSPDTHAAQQGASVDDGALRPMATAKQDGTPLLAWMPFCDEYRILIWSLPVYADQACWCIESADGEKHAAEPHCGEPAGWTLFPSREAPTPQPAVAEFDIEPKLPGVSEAAGPEPSIREMVFRYYEREFPTTAARRLTDAYFAAIRQTALLGTREAK